MVIAVKALTINYSILSTVLHWRHCLHFLFTFRSFVLVLACFSWCSSSLLICFIGGKGTMSPSDSDHASLCERQNNNNNNNRHFYGAWSLARPLFNKEEVGCLFTSTRCCRHNPRCRRSTGRWSPRCTGSPLPRPVRSSSWPISCYTTANKYKRPFSCFVCCFVFNAQSILWIIMFRRNSLKTSNTTSKTKTKGSETRTTASFLKQDPNL